MAGSSGSGGASKSLVWKGEALTERMRAAQIAGVNKTMGACVAHAKTNHPWKNRTGILEGGVDVVDYAAPTGAGVEGTWGVRDVGYAAALELGATIAHPGGTAYYIDESGKAVFIANASPLSEGLPRTKPHEIILPAHPFLRPAADVKYPDLPANIRKAYEKSKPGGGGKGGAGGGSGTKGGDGGA